ncbi:unnamed protein product [Rhizophagus irregularis]|uniref:MATA-HMG n=2 Tax=Rhizophagus irregularis TaxID=588596 RepID=A0A1B1EVH2_9GLOM|nr:MATA-HMG [Rhizophagus irregularis]CAB4380575.1 unnamed protein product [Rhizophagus irregularis]CAB5373339.1 unnamed protein product [Rhizophagus irregularis]
MIPETNVQPDKMETIDNFIHECPNKKQRTSPNGFIKYRTVEWKRFKKENPNITTQQFSSIAAKKWNKMTGSQKNYYIKLKLETSPKKNNRDRVGPKRKYNKKNKKNEQNINQELPIEYPPVDLNYYNNYNEENFHINQADEYFLSYPNVFNFDDKLSAMQEIYPIYYDAFHDFFYFNI